MNERILGLPYAVWIVIAWPSRWHDSHQDPVRPKRLRGGRRRRGRPSRRGERGAVRVRMMVICSVMAGRPASPSPSARAPATTGRRRAGAGLDRGGGRGWRLDLRRAWNAARSAGRRGVHQHPAQRDEPAGGARCSKGWSRAPLPSWRWCVQPEGGMSYGRLVGFGEAMLRMTVRPGVALEDPRRLRGLRRRRRVERLHRHGCAPACPPPRSVRSPTVRWAAHLPPRPGQRRRCRGRAQDPARLGLYFLEMAPPPHSLRITYGPDGVGVRVARARQRRLEARPRTRHVPPPHRHHAATRRRPSPRRGAGAHDGGRGRGHPSPWTSNRLPDGALVP